MDFSRAALLKVQCDPSGELIYYLQILIWQGRPDKPWPVLTLLARGRFNPCWGEVYSVDGWLVAVRTLPLIVVQLAIPRSVH